MKRQSYSFTDELHASPQEGLTANPIYIQIDHFTPVGELSKIGSQINGKFRVNLDHQIPLMHEMGKGLT